MPRKERFPSEAKTEPDLRRGKAATHRGGARATAPATAERVPPATTTRPPGRRASHRTSGVRAGKSEMPSATVDVVTADLSKDPRVDDEDE